MRSDHRLSRNGRNGLVQISISNFKKFCSFLKFERMVDQRYRVCRLYSVVFNRNLMIRPFDLCASSGEFRDEVCRPIKTIDSGTVDRTMVINGHLSNGALSDSGSLV